MGATHKLHEDDLLQLRADEFTQRWVALLSPARQEPRFAVDVMSRTSAASVTLYAIVSRINAAP
jgi:hypothetical protein